MGSSFVAVQLVSVLALVSVVLICRWVFSSGSRPSAPSSTEIDLGLLTPVASVRTREDAEMLRSLLQEAGVRAGISEQAGEFQVLVFTKDVELARQLVSSG